MSKPVAFTLVLLTLFCGLAGAQSFVFADFSSVVGLTMNGSATQSGNVLRVVPNAGGQQGTVFVTVPQPVVLGFDTYFTFQISNPAGADGLAFIIQNDALGTAAMGGTGGQISYGAGQFVPPGVVPISNSLVVEIDTYVNGHPSGVADLGMNEISIHTNGSGANGEDEVFSIGRVLSTVPLNDGSPHTMRILYTPGSPTAPGTLDIFIDFSVTPILSVPYDIVTGGTHVVAGGAVGGLSLLNGSGAYVGFGAGTGGLFADHDILTWQWTSTTMDPCFAGNVGMSAGGPFDVLTVNGSSGGLLRRETVYTYDPFSFGMSQPSSSATPASFVVFGMTGFPGPTDVYPLPLGLGNMCFAPWVLAQYPGLFILADSFSVNPFALLPSTPTPWSFTYAPGLNFPFQIAIQGVIAESPGMFSITNAVQMDIVNAPPPVISSLSPTAATSGGIISILGTGFRPGLTLDVGGVIVTPQALTPTQVDFVVPAGLGCDVAVTVTNTDGQTASATMNPTPTVLNTVFPSGGTAGGNNFIITGSGFSPGTTVTIGGAMATILSSSTAAIICQTPPGTLGTAQVVITTPGGCTVTTVYTYI